MCGAIVFYTQSMGKFKLNYSAPLQKNMENFCSDVINFAVAAIIFTAILL